MRLSQEKYDLTRIRNEQLDAVNQSVDSSVDMERQFHPLRTAGIQLSNLFNWRRILGIEQPMGEEPNLELQ